MNALTYEFLIRWQHDLRVMAKAPGAGHTFPWLPAIDRTAEPWKAIDECRRIMESVGRDAPGPGAPLLYVERHRLAWLNLLRAAFAADGWTEEEPPRYRRMTTVGLACEIDDAIEQAGAAAK